LDSVFRKQPSPQSTKRQKPATVRHSIHFSGKDDLLIVLMEDAMNRFYEIASMSYEPTSKQEAVEMITMQIPFGGGHF
jgi:hypothetical protein